MRMIKRKGTRMKTLNIDIETYSSADLNRTGVYRYCESADFEILLFGYALGKFTSLMLRRAKRYPTKLSEQYLTRA